MSYGLNERDDTSRSPERLLEHARRALRRWRERGAEALAALQSGEPSGIDRALQALEARDRAFANFRAISDLLDHATPTPTTPWTDDTELQSEAHLATLIDAELTAQIHQNLASLEQTSGRLAHGRDALRGYTHGGTVGLGFVRRA